MTVLLPGGIELPIDLPAGGLDFTLVLVAVIVGLVLLFLIFLFTRKPAAPGASGGATRGYYRPGEAPAKPASTPAPAPQPVAAAPTTTATGEAREAPIPDVLAFPSEAGEKTLPELPTEVAEKPPEPRWVDVVEGCEVDIFSPFKLFGSNAAGQQFLASGERVTSAAVKAYKQGNPRGLVFEIQEDAGGVPSGNVLATETVGAENISSNLLGTWVNTTFECPVKRGEKYWLVLRQKDWSGDGSNRIEIKGVYRDEYKNGICAETTDAAKTWSKRSYYDTAFKVGLQKKEYG